jgi:GDPmannose 4,6-dehydratase
MQADLAADYVVATGESHTVREFLTEAFTYAGLDWEQHVEFDPRYLRPTEVDDLRGDASKIRRELGWEPRVGFTELVRAMVDADVAMAEGERSLVAAGYAPAPQRLKAW